MPMARAATPTERAMNAASLVSSAAVRYSAIAAGVSSVAAASKGIVLVLGACLDNSGLWWRRLLELDFVCL